LNENSRTIRLPVNVVQDMQKDKKSAERENKDISEKFAVLPRIIDLDMHINDEGDTLIDVIKNENVESPDAVFSSKDVLKEKMMNIMSVLDERERIIVEDYYGITGTPRTLEDIGSDFSLTKERVRQIKEKALRKLRNECSDLFEYM
jgi:RNA polymerase primary sigma factor